MAETFPPNTTLTALSGTQSSGGQPYPTIGETPWYDDAFKAQYWSEQASQQSNALRVYKSGNLTFGIYAGKFRKADGTIISYGGSDTNSIATTATLSVWLDNTGTLQTASSFPSASDILRLATVTTDGSGITSITNQRVVAFTDTFGSALPSSGAGNQVLATPSNGSTGPVALRQIVGSDVVTNPSFNGTLSCGSLSVNGSNISITGNTIVAFGKTLDIGTIAATGNISTTGNVSGHGIGGQTILLTPPAYFSTSGTDNPAKITTSYFDAGTASSCDFLISRTDNATGSGTQRFIDCQNGGTSKFYVDNLGNVTGNNLSGTNTGDQTLVGLGGVPTTRTISTTAPMTGGGDLSANRTLSMPAATASVDGYLAHVDWTTFNNKAPTASPTFTGTVTAGGSGQYGTILSVRGTTCLQMTDPDFGTESMSFKMGSATHRMTLQSGYSGANEMCVDYINDRIFFGTVTDDSSGARVQVSGGLSTTGTTAANPVLKLKGAASQSGNYLTVIANGGSSVYSIGSTGLHSLTTSGGNAVSINDTTNSVLLNYGTDATGAYIGTQSSKPFRVIVGNSPVATFSVGGAFTPIGLTFAAGSSTVMALAGNSINMNNGGLSGGGTLNMDNGNITNGGQIHGTHYGDGSNLTGLPAGPTTAGINDILANNSNASGFSIIGLANLGCSSVAAAGAISAGTSISAGSLSVSGALADGTYSVGSSGGSITITNGVITAIS